MNPAFVWSLVKGRNIQTTSDTAHSGKWSVDVDARIPIHMIQRVTVSSSGTYTASFFAVNDCNQGVKNVFLEMQGSIDTSILRKDFNVNPGTTWTQFTWNVDLNADSYSFKIGSFDPPKTNCGSKVDDIALIPINSPDTQMPSAGNTQNPPLIAPIVQPSLTTVASTSANTPKSNSLNPFPTNNANSILVTGNDKAGSSLTGSGVDSNDAVVQLAPAYNNDAKSSASDSSSQKSLGPLEISSIVCVCIFLLVIALYAWRTCTRTSCQNEMFKRRLNHIALLNNKPTSLSSKPMQTLIAIPEEPFRQSSMNISTPSKMHLEASRDDTRDRRLSEIFASNRGSQSELGLSDMLEGAKIKNTSMLESYHHRFSMDYSRGSTIESERSTVRSTFFYFLNEK